MSPRKKAKSLRAARRASRTKAAILAAALTAAAGLAWAQGALPPGFEDPADALRAQADRMRVEAPAPASAPAAATSAPPGAEAAPFNQESLRIDSRRLTDAFSEQGAVGRLANQAAAAAGLSRTEILIGAGLAGLLGLWLILRAFRRPNRAAEAHRAARRRSADPDVWLGDEDDEPAPPPRRRAAPEARRAAPADGSWDESAPEAAPEPAPAPRRPNLDRLAASIRETWPRGASTDEEAPAPRLSGERNFLDALAETEARAPGAEALARVRALGEQARQGA